jgi:hypothetical protein
MFEAIDAGDAGEVRGLLECTPELLTETIGSDTWLHIAAMHDNPEVVETLVAAGMDVNVPRTDALEGPLYEAASFNCVNVTRWLLENGANANAGGGTRPPPLISAIHGGSLEIVELLLRHGADVNLSFVPYRKGETINPLKYALMYGRKEIAELLRAHGAVLPKDETRPDVGGLRNEIIRRMEKHLGPVQEVALTEIVCGEVSLSVHVVPPTLERNWITLFTTGMSDKAMTVPPDCEKYQHAELLIHLPADWPLTGKLLKKAKNFWPVEWLRRIAHYPHENRTWLTGDHAVIANGDPPKRLAPGVGFTCLLVLAKHTKSGWLKSRSGRTVCFYTVFPIYTEERDFEAAHGARELLRLFQENRVAAVVDPERVNVAKLAPGSRKRSK